MKPEKTLVLDTCALIWLVKGDRSLSEYSRQLIEQASLVFVSAITAWEVSLKTTRKTLHLPLDPLDWFERAVFKHNLVLSPLDPQLLCAANLLPWHHKDPADRFIIATAIREKAAVVTHDAIFQKYGLTVIK